MPIFQKPKKMPVLQGILKFCKAGMIVTSGRQFDREPLTLLAIIIEVASSQTKTTN